ncbi:MAG: hypothetical protein NC920_05750 [Candidatus Omnitrophica bacterium]|nr:hypothetical protein [Candidatus Omnitrophota bacterium]MCM8798116.1 hypothetical protein [Candidatus Omnitrophota bacterium]
MKLFLRRTIIYIGLFLLYLNLSPIEKSGVNLSEILLRQTTRRIKDALVQIIRDNKEPLDYTKLFGTSQIIVVGETPGLRRSILDETIRELSFFKENLEFTHLGLEMFPSDRQYLLEVFFKKNDLREADEFAQQFILPVIKEYWGGDVEMYMELIKTAKRVGMKGIVALGPPNLTSEESNAWIAKQTQKILEENQANKILIYVDYRKIEGNQVPRVLKNLLGGEKLITSLRYVSGTNPCPICAGYTPIETAIFRAGLGSEKFMLDLRRIKNISFPLPQVDGIINLPSIP